jgi:hypothetical protein
MSLNKLSKVIGLEKFFAGQTLPLAARALVVVSALLASPAVNADCLPSVPNGWRIPFTMSTHNDATNEVTYSTGTLTDTGPTFVTPAILSGDGFPELFSDRYVPSCTNCFVSQPFNVAQANRVGLSITRTIETLGHPSVIGITLTFDSLGDAKVTFAGACDATTSLLYGSYYNNTMAVISFGAPFNPEIQ